MARRVRNAWPVVRMAHSYRRHGLALSQCCYPLNRGALSLGADCFFSSSDGGRRKRRRREDKGNLLELAQSAGGMGHEEVPHVMRDSRRRSRSMQNTADSHVQSCLHGVFFFQNGRSSRDRDRLFVCLRVSNTTSRTRDLMSC